MNSYAIPASQTPAAETAESCAFFDELRNRYVPRVAHSAALGMSVDEISTTSGRLRLPCRPEFVGDPVRNFIHNGVLVSLIDSACGCAVSARIGRSQRIATLDLRVDYLRPVVLGDDLVCEAECYRMAGSIAFVRACLWQADAPKRPVAQAVATFMRSRSALKAVL